MTNNHTITTAVYTNRILTLISIPLLLQVKLAMHPEKPNSQTAFVIMTRMAAKPGGNNMF